MVLISHEHELIFIKSMKSAGTSIEESIEYHLLGTPSQGFGEVTQERIGQDFYVSSRGLELSSDFIRSHASCQQLLRFLGQDRFSKYTKVSSVRNPWDQTASYFWWGLRNRTYLLSLASKLPMLMVKVWFSVWYLTNQEKINKQLSFTRKFGVSGIIPAMHLIRYESLDSDLKDLLEKMGHPDQDVRVSRRKSHVRNREEHFQRYYFRIVRESVARQRSADLSNFGYKWVAESDLP